jgi:hypothetical protein
VLRVNYNYVPVYLVFSLVDIRMGQTYNVNPITEHALFLRLFITNGGGW